VAEWGARVSDNCEADDTIGIQATKYWKEDIKFVVCTLDKDMRQIPGKHYSWEFAGTSYGKQWVKPEEHFYVTPMDGMKFFYRQMLIGDTSDNVVGVKGVGKVGAAKHIDHLSTEEEMIEVVRGLYNDDERFIKNGQLLWLQRESGEIWTRSLSA
jgi:DNA polymerase-1